MAAKTDFQITPRTKVGELLDYFPELEPVLMELAPAFRRLKNPILRKTIGKVATLQQASLIGNISVGDLVNRLRKEVGQEQLIMSDAASGTQGLPPGWLKEKKIAIAFDATLLINSGKNPMQQILHNLDKTEKDEVFKLTSPFIPAPIIDKISKMGYEHYTNKISETEFHTFFHKPDNSG